VHEGTLSADGAEKPEPKISQTGETKAQTVRTPGFDRCIPLRNDAPIAVFKGVLN
jgi:hypothetical protein